MTDLRKFKSLSIIVSLLGCILGASLLSAVLSFQSALPTIVNGDSQFWNTAAAAYYAGFLGLMFLSCLVFCSITYRNIVKKLNTACATLVNNVPNIRMTKTENGNDIIVCINNALNTGANQLSSLHKEQQELRSELDSLRIQLTQAHAETETVRERAEMSRRDSLLSASKTLGTAITGIHGASDNLLSLSRSAGDGAQKQQQYVQDVSQFMSELNSAIEQMHERSVEAVNQAQQAQDKARDGSRIVENTVESIRQVERKAEDLAAVVRGLGDQAKAVEKIMEVISDIADQTNLLALNAAIEAARAGDAGRGFAVVADEVRKLAEKTMNATREVAQRIDGIQKGVDDTERDMQETSNRVDEAVELAQSSGSSLKEIVSLVGETVGQMDRLSDAARQQAETSSQVDGIVQKVSAISETSYEGSQNSSQAVDGLLGRVLELESMNSVFQLIGDGGVQSTVEKLAASPVIRSMQRQAMEQAMFEALRGNHSFELIYITDNTGKQCVSNVGRGDGGITADSSSYGKQWGARAWFIQPVQLGGTVVSEVYVSSATGQNCITVSTPIRNEKNEVIGVLATDINLGKATQSHIC